MTPERTSEPPFHAFQQSQESFERSVTWPHRKSGCLCPPLDINRILSAHAANFSLGLSPALEASRTSMSKLNCLNFPRLISDTLACVMPRTLAA